jgi:hypothetical protein
MPVAEAMSWSSYSFNSFSLMAMGVMPYTEFAINSAMSALAIAEVKLSTRYSTWEVPVPQNIKKVMVVMNMRLDLWLRVA